MDVSELSAWRRQTLWAVGVMAFVVLLSATSADAPAAEPLRVGGLPVT